MMAQKNLIYTQKEKEKSISFWIENTRFWLGLHDVNWNDRFKKASKSLSSSFISKEKINWSQ